MAACVLFLAINQEIQTKVYDEILEICQDDQSIDYERLNELKYLEMVLKETLRLFSPIPIFIREAIDDCDVGTGKTLKRGTKVFILNHIIHRRKDIWGENCSRFDPQNFSAENCSRRDPYSFAPFGTVSSFEILKYQLIIKILSRALEIVLEIVTL